MKRAKKLLSLMLALAVAAVSLGGCGNSGGNTSASGTGASSKEGSSLPMHVTGTVDDSKTLTTLINSDASPAFNGNPFDDTAGADWSIQPFLFDYLALFSPYPTRTFKTSLLESYTYEDKTCTMKLKPDLKWSDGSALDADDVLTNYYCNVGRSTIWNYIKTIEKEDPLTIKITYCTDSDLVLNLTFNDPIVTPNEIFGKWADQYREIAEKGREYDSVNGIYNYTKEASDQLTKINQSLLSYKPKPDEVISSGPYVISKWNTSEVLFDVNPQYRKKPLITKIRGLRPGDSQAFSTAILANEYTIENGGLSSDMSDQIDKRFSSTMRKIFVPEFSQIGFSFNTDKYPLNIPEVRKAICMMVDRNSLLKVAEPGSAAGDKYNSGLLPSLQKSYADGDFLKTLTSYDYNPTKAAELLESVGWKQQNGKWVDKDGQSPKISLSTISSWPTFMMTGEAMSSMLEDQGLNIDFKPQEVGVYNNDTEKMISCTFIASAAGYVHPWESFNGYFLGSSTTVFKKLNPNEKRVLTLPSTGEKVDVSQLINELYTSKDNAKTKQITEQLMKIGNDECGFLSAVEKTTPLRIYDPKLSLADAKLNSVQMNYYYFGNLNNILVKLIQDDLLYFVK